MPEENKPKAETQAPAKTEPTEEQKREVAGLDAIAKDPKKLRELYKQSPQMFKEVAEEIEAEKKGKEAQKPTDQKPQSAAPAAKVAKYGEAEIKLPEGVNEDMVPVYLDHWKEQGWSPEQVQKEVSFMGDLAAKAKAKKQPTETPEQRAAREDGENVAALKSDPEFGKDFDKNFEIARRAALKYGTKEMIARLTTSDRVAVKQFWKLGLQDVEDSTPNGGKPRNGNEDEEAKRREEEAANPRSEPAMKKRYPNSPNMKFT